CTHLIKIDFGMNAWDKDACSVKQAHQPAQQRNEKQEEEQPTWHDPVGGFNLCAQVAEHEDGNIKSLQTSGNRDQLFGRFFEASNGLYWCLVPHLTPILSRAFQELLFLGVEFLARCWRRHIVFS